MNNNHQKQEAVPEIKFLRYLPLLVIGLAAVILLINMAEFRNIADVLRNISAWPVVMAVGAQICSYLGSGYLLKVIMGRGNFRITVGRGTFIYMASESIGLAGGLTSAAIATYYWVSRGGRYSGEAVMAGILPTLYNAVVLIAVTVSGMTYMIFYHELSRNQILIYGFILGIIMALTIISFYGLKHRESIERLVFGIVKILRRLLKHEYNPLMISNRIDQFYNGLRLLGNSDRIKLGIGPAVNIVFDVLTLYLFFNAAGYVIRPSILVAGYGLSFLMGRGAFFIPGGAGVIEGGMVAVYTNLGVPFDISVVAVLCYRFISFWLPSLLGFAAMIHLQKTSAR